jgi:hypothetical protein
MDDDQPTTTGNWRTGEENRKKKIPFHRARSIQAPIPPTTKKKKHKHQKKTAFKSSNHVIYQPPLLPRQPRSHSPPQPSILELRASLSLDSLFKRSNFLSINGENGLIALMW